MLRPINNLVTFKSFTYRWRKMRLSLRDPVEVLTDFLNIPRERALEYKAEFDSLELPPKEERDWSANDKVIEVEYLVCRAMKPGLLVETGVNAGRSSLVILTAMQKNETGRLISIDLPAQHLNESPGGLVPQDLRANWDLRLGDATELLPEVLDEVGGPDIFIHDSDHSYSHMLWELQTAAAYMKPGSLLLADDLRPSAEALVDFSAARRGSAYRIDRLGLFLMA